MRLLAFVLVALACSVASAQTPTTFSDGQVLSAAALNAAFATKQDFHAPVRAATTGSNITLSGLQTIDGVSLNAGDRVLVKDQSDPTTNGIYTVAAGAWTRASDASAAVQWYQGLSVLVTAGTANAGGGNNPTVWLVSAANPIVIGTTALTWQFKP